MANSRIIAAARLVASTSLAMVVVLSAKAPAWAGTNGVLVDVDEFRENQQQLVSLTASNRTLQSRIRASREEIAALEERKIMAESRKHDSASLRSHFESLAAGSLIEWRLQDGRTFSGALLSADATGAVMRTVRGQTVTVARIRFADADNRFLDDLVHFRNREQDAPPPVPGPVQTGETP